MRLAPRMITVATLAVACLAVSAPPADAYLYQRNGYTFADTSYRGNVSGSYFKVRSRFDARFGVLFITLDGYDKVCDSRQAAVRVRGWDRQSGDWRYEQVLWVADPCKGRGQGAVAVPVGRDRLDSVVVADGIRDRGFGSRWVGIWYR